MNLNGLLTGLSKINGSDLHLKVGAPPIMRVNSVLRPVDHPNIQYEELRSIIDSIVPSQHREYFDRVGAIDFGYTIEGVGRYRMAAFRQRNEVSLVARRISLELPNIADLELPKAVQKLVNETRGMILVTGVTGSGKSTTMAAILNYINQSRREHIVTLEDPIEFVFTDKRSIINQVEIGTDMPTFADGMKHAMRWDPDVIMIGEMRDRVTVEAALAAADTGHMVMSTLHTSDAKQTMNRVLHFFPREDEELILEQLSMNLKAIVSQRLFNRCDIKGLIPCIEFLYNTPIVGKLIREGRISDLDQVLKNRQEDMQSFDVSLALLVRDGKIDQELALQYSTDIASIKRMLRGEFDTSDQQGLIGN